MVKPATVLSHSLHFTCIFPCAVAAVSSVDKLKKGTAALEALGLSRECGPERTPKRQMTWSGGVYCLLCVFCVWLRRSAVGRRGSRTMEIHPPPIRAPPRTSKNNLEFPCNLPRKLITGYNRYPLSYVSAYICPGTLGLLGTNFMGTQPVT